MTAEVVVLSRAPEQTAAVGEALGRLARPGELIALSGALGAGKTQLAKGIARGLGVAEDEPVVSPTFVLLREYTGRLPLFHADAYRLTAAAELDALGLDELRRERGGVVIVEWADRFAEALAAATLSVALAHVDANSRELRISVRDDARRPLLAAALGEFLRPA